MWRHFARQAAAAAARRGSRTPVRPLACQCRSQISQSMRRASGNRWAGKAVLAFLGAAAAAGSAPVAFADALDEKSFIMIKPDGVQRGLIAAVIKRFEDKGYKLVAIKIIKPSTDLAQQHYQEHEGKPFYPGLVQFLSSGPVVAMVWEGKEVIKTGRGLIGSTSPLASAPGTIRGDFGIDVGRNLIHGSDSIDSAQKEIALWFKPGELASYEPTVAGWIYESKSKL